MVLGFFIDVAGQAADHFAYHFMGTRIVRFGKVSVGFDGELKYVDIGFPEVVSASASFVFHHAGVGVYCPIIRLYG